MTKAALLLILLIFVFKPHGRCQETASQKSYTQQLREQFATTNNTAKKDSILDELVKAYIWYKPDSALFFAQQRIQLAQAVNAPQKEALATGYYGTTLGLMANYPEAVKYLLKGLEMAQRAGDTKDYNFFYDALSNTFIEQGNFDLALSYANQFQTISIHKRDTLYYGWLLTKGVLYEKSGHLDSALFFLERVFDYDMRKSHRITRERTLLSLGNVFFKKGAFPEALRFYGMTVDMALPKGNYINLADALNSIAQLYDSTNQLDSGIYYATEGLRTSQITFYTLGQLTANSTLADLYKKKGDRDKALDYLETTVALKDSLFNQQKERAVQNLFFDDRMRQRDLADAEQRLRTKWRTIGLITGVLVLLILAGILYRNNQNKQRAYTLLQKQKAETDQAKEKAETAIEELKATQAQLIQREKMASLGELTTGVAHEIQNPLNFVNNFAEVNAELIDELKEEITKLAISETEKQTVLAVIGDLGQNQHRINHHGKRADAIVKSMLQHSLPTTGEKILTDINKLAEEYLRLSYHHFLAKDKTFAPVVNTQFDSTIGDVLIMPQELGKALLNLFNNAFYYVSEKKHTLKEKYDPIVTVTTKRINGNVEIMIQDNGTGIPEKNLDKIYKPFFTTKPSGSGTGLGLYLSYDIVTKGHNGEIKVTTKEGEYARFTVVLPV